MRKLIFYTTISLDGLFSGPNGELDYFEPNEEEHQYANDLVRDADVLLCGRGMYEIMSYWDSFDLADPSSPRVAREFAAIYQSKPRVVFSTTLATVDAKARLVKEDIFSEVASLKQQEGSYLLLGCGPDLLAQFLRQGLVDEVRLHVLPLILGEGVPLFGSVDQRVELKLSSTHQYARGSLLLTYTTNER